MDKKESEHLMELIKCKDDELYKCYDVIEVLNRQIKEFTEQIEHLRKLNELKYAEYEKRLSDNATIIVNQHNRIKDQEIFISKLEDKAVNATILKDEMKIKELDKENEKLKDLLNRSNVRLSEEQIKNEELKKKVFIQNEIIIGEQTENEELKKENNILIKGLGCETCSIHLEYENLNNQIEELKAQIEKMKCCENCQKTKKATCDDNLRVLAIIKRQCDKWELREELVNDCRESDCD